MARVNKRGFKQNIPTDLWKQWKKNKRRGDPEKIAAEIKISRPMVDRALIYGHVTMEGVTEKITNFFAERKTREAQQATELAGKL